jgi:hypothetical protein
LEERVTELAEDECIETGNIKWLKVLVLESFEQVDGLTSCLVDQLLLTPFKYRMKKDIQVATIIRVPFVGIVEQQAMNEDIVLEHGEPRTNWRSLEAQSGLIDLSSRT